MVRPFWVIRKEIPKQVANRARSFRCVVRIPTPKQTISEPKKGARFADHLGERSVRIREVESSSLFRSTIKAVKSSISRLFYYFFEKLPGLRKSKISTQLKRGSARFASLFQLLKKQQK